eukprot:2992690-Pleurochrysis_carterae.AAC.6
MTVRVSGTAMTYLASQPMPIAAECGALTECGRPASSHVPRARVSHLRAHTRTRGDEEPARWCALLNARTRKNTRTR